MSDISSSTESVVAREWEKLSHRVAERKMFLSNAAANARARNKKRLAQRRAKKRLQVEASQCELGAFGMMDRTIQARMPPQFFWQSGKCVTSVNGVGGKRDWV